MQNAFAASARTGKRAAFSSVCVEAPSSDLPFAVRIKENFIDFFSAIWFNSV